MRNDWYSVVFGSSFCELLLEALVLLARCVSRTGGRPAAEVGLGWHRLFWEATFPELKKAGNRIRHGMYWLFRLASSRRTVRSTGSGLFSERYSLAPPRFSPFPAVKVR